MQIGDDVLSGGGEPCFRRFEAEDVGDGLEEDCEGEVRLEDTPAIETTADDKSRAEVGLEDGERDCPPGTKRNFGLCSIFIYRGHQSNAGNVAQISGGT